VLAQQSCFVTTDYEKLKYEGTMLIRSITFSLRAPLSSSISLCSVHDRFYGSASL